MSTSELVLNILSEIKDCSNISNDTLLFERGILDSFSVLYLISELESRLNITIPLENVVESNFATIENITAFTSVSMQKKQPID